MGVQRPAGSGIDVPPTERLPSPAKHHPPSVDPRQVPRGAITDAIVDTRAKLVLVRAPAGFGKTTVMAQARQRLADRGDATVWFTLDSADNDSSRFLAYLSRAIDDLLSVEPTSDDEGPQAGTLGEFAVRLFEKIASIEVGVAIFLDEFEAITSPGVLALVAQLLERLPHGSRLVIGSRTVPDLRIARLRASGLLLEIDAQRLRFSLEETAAFFAARAQTMQMHDVELLQHKTEGWAAAVWLAWIAIENHDQPSEFIKEFSGADANVAEYLAEEVFALQSEHVQKLLLSTSILRELSAPLCKALLPGLDTDAALRKLSLGNMFLMPVESKPGHWRYHSLFSSFLTDRLRKSMPQDLPRLHLAAANWFLAEGRPVPAIDHFIESGDFSRAVEVLYTQATPLLMQGRLRLLARWFDALPASEVKAKPRLQIAQAWATCFTRGPQAALALMRNSGVEGWTDTRAVAHVAALRAMLLALLDRWEESHKAGWDSLQLLPSPAAFANATLVNSTATSAVVLGKYARARQLLAQARDSQSQGPSAFHKMYSETVEGMIDLAQGRLRQARARFSLAVQTTQVSALDPTDGHAWAGLLYGATIYESGDLQQAKRLLQIHLPLARDAWITDHIIIGYCILARIALAEGEVDHAFQGISELEYLGHERQLPRLAATAHLERARMLLLQGYAEAAADELRNAGSPELWSVVESRRHLGNDTNDRTIGELRWLAIAGDARQAETSLQAAAVQAGRSALVRRQQKLQVLRAIALARCGDEMKSHAVLLPVLKMAAAEGAVRFVVEEGPRAAELVVREQARLEESSGDPIFADYLQRLRSAFGPLAADISSAPPPSGTQPAEVLSPKELRVLQLLSEGYSNRALTEKLFVSDSTVRTHLRNINRKLGTGNRLRAVAVARRLGLVR